MDYLLVQNCSEMIQRQEINFSSKVKVYVHMARVQDALGEKAQVKLERLQKRDTTPTLPCRGAE